MDLKKTSYKKLGKLLSVFEKRGLLTQKLVHKQEHLATVNREHKLYTAFAALHAGSQVRPSSRNMGLSYSLKAGPASGGPTLIPETMCPPQDQPSICPC